jgi:hypothetical protein
MITRPADREAEEAVLGAMLLSSEAASKVLETLRPEHFTTPDHRLVFEGIRDLRSRGLPADMVALKDELRRRGKLNSERGLYVQHLAETLASPASAEYHARIVVEHADRRRLLESLHEAQQALTAGAAPEDVRARLRPTMRADKPVEATGLPIVGVREVARRVQETGSASWLVEGLWPGDAYGVLGAEDKAGKTWALLDLGVSVVTGTPWLNGFPCPSPGPVLLLLGEGGERAMIRRLGAIAADRGRDLDDLDGLRLSFAVPRLTDRRDLEAVVAELEAHPARLVGLDPLYLAAPAGKGADLYAMGEALYGLQRACQDAGSALVITTHWTKTGEGTGPRRFTGVGPGAWGRVLGSAAVEQRRHGDDGGSEVLLRWEFSGSEIGEQSFRVRRRVRAHDPLDLESALSYSVQVTEAEAESSEEARRSPSQRRVLAILEETTEGDGLTVRDIGDRLAEDGLGPPLQRRTIQKALAALTTEGEVDGEDPGTGLAGRWWRSR